MSTFPRKTPFLFPSATVSVLSGLVGCFFGLFAALGYGLSGKGPGHDWVGHIGFAVGATSGVAVGVLWSKWMTRKALAYLAQGKVPAGPVFGYAALGGGLAGTVSTLILHASLTVAAAPLRADVTSLSIDLAELWVLGLFFGVFAGAFVGLFGGLVWLVALRRAARFFNDTAPTA